MFTHSQDLPSFPQFAIDLDHKITYWNEACEKLTGLSTAEMIGTDRQWQPFYQTKRFVLADLIIGNDLKTLLQLYENQSIQKSTLVPHAWEATDLFIMGGIKHHIHFLAAPILDNIGAIIGAMETLIHVSPGASNNIAADQALSDTLLVDLEPSCTDINYDFSKIIGKSMAMREIFAQTSTAAATSANIIIYGESGTGKELIAKAIHNISKRCHSEFVAVNCGAISEHLVESEFFGYKKGAFTGADIDKPGFFDRANGGTLFLDEVGEVSMNMQVKLLRTIEGYGFLPVGSAETKKTDLRIIAATNRNLMDLVKNGLMRDDFFYRIHIIPIHIPPLRNRKEDILPLANHFLKINSKQGEKLSLPAHDVKKLLAYNWPGNIRELQNVMLRYIALRKLDLLGEASHGETLSVEIMAQHTTQSLDLHLNVAIVEKKLILIALNKYQWQRNEVASALNISRKTLYRKMKIYGLIAPANK